MSRTLAGRVAGAVVLAAALGAAATAAATNALAWRWSLAREDVRLGAAAETLLQELTESNDVTAANEEDRELAPAGLRIALWQGDSRRGGAAGLRPGPAGCGAMEWDGAAWRRCTVRRGARAVVVASPFAPFEATRRAWLGASVTAVLLASLLALAAGRATAARTVAPLTRLRGSLDGVRGDAPDPAVLAPAEGFDELDALRTALAALLSRQREALARSRRFAADAAHELRTPLATARAELELAAETPDLPAELARSLSRAHGTLLRMGALAERLLILAAPAEGLVGAEPVCLADIARDAVDALPEAARGRVTLRAEDDGVLRGEPTLLRVMVDNALDNALKFAPAGAVTVEVTARGGELTLRVRDEGPGVAPEERARVFEAFHRAASARAGGARGHGVGLALVAHVAAAHGGAARFEDTPRGACLCVTLPAWRPDGA